MIKKTRNNLQKIIGATPKPIPIGKRITEQEIQDHLLEYFLRTGKNSIVMGNSTASYYLEELNGCKKGYFEISNMKLR